MDWDIEGKERIKEETWYSRMGDEYIDWGGEGAG